MAANTGTGDYARNASPSAAVNSAIPRPAFLLYCVRIEQLHLRTRKCFDNMTFHPPTWRNDFAKIKKNAFAADTQVACLSEELLLAVMSHIDQKEEQGSSPFVFY